VLSIRSRSGKLVAGSVAVAVALTAATVASGGSAQAATTPNAQSVGRFLDGALGGNPIQSLADVKDARAVNPGSTSVQNPLTASLLNHALTLPLDGALQLPQLLGINLGAVNQVAQANADGSSFGASGAVDNGGGVSIGGQNGFPSDATINLTASGLAGNSLGSGSLPGLGSLGSLGDALGGITVKLGALSSNVVTPTGYDKGATTDYNIADATITIGSPALGSLLSTLLGPSGAVSGLVNSLTSALGNTLGLPAACNLGTILTSTLTLEGGAIVIDPTAGGITIDLEKLLDQLGLKINDLPANTDLIDYLLNYLTSANGLTQGLINIFNGLTNPLEQKLTDCTKALTGSATAPNPGTGSNVSGLTGLLGGLLGGLLPSGGGSVTNLIGTLINTVLGLLNTGQSTLENLVTNLVSGLGGLGSTPLLAPLGNLLKQLIDIGVNVQPNTKSGDFTSKLAATPNQATTPVAGQTVERALEIDVLGKTLDLGLANSAAGPSVAPAGPTGSNGHQPTSTGRNPGGSSANVIPTGVNAGLAAHGGSPVLPLVLLSLGLMVAAGGAAAWRLRGGRHVA